MAKSGEARVPTAAQQRLLFDVIQEHRHPEKNAAIMRPALSLGFVAKRFHYCKLKK